MAKTEEKIKKAHHTEKSNFYPKLVIKNNEHPDSVFALPIVGLLIKLVMLIPAGIFLLAIGIVFGILWFLTPFYILFTGKYWDTAAEFALGYMIYKTKITLFIAGLTDTYPGFNLRTNGIFEIELKKPTKINRWLAFPIVGSILRLIFLIPYSIYQSIMNTGSVAAIIAAPFAIMAKGKYPESLYEFNRDSIRVSLAYTSYLAYFSDEYPSFWISLNHKAVKITLLIIGAILYILSNFGRSNAPQNRHMPQRPMMQNNHMQQQYDQPQRPSSGY